MVVSLRALRSDEPQVPGANSGHLGLAFGLGALTVFGLDLALVSWGGAVDDDGALSLLRFIPTFLVAVPALCGLCGMAGGLVRQALLRPPGRRFARSALADLVAAAIPLLLVSSLFSGPAISRSPWRLPLIICALALVFGAVWLLRVAGARAARWFGTAGRIALPATAVLLLFVVGFAIVLRWVSAAVFAGLYAAFQQLLALAALALVAAGLYAILAPRVIRFGRRRIIPVLTAIFVVSWPLGLVASHSAPLGRQLLADHGSFSGSFVGPIFQVEKRLYWLFAPAPREKEPGTDASFGNVVFGEDSPRRSVLLITVDALRGDVLDPDGGFLEQTTQLRGLAQRAILFQRAYSPGNKTKIFVPSMLLGRHVDRYTDALLEGESLPAVFSRAGYRTHCLFTYHEALRTSELASLTASGFFFDTYDKEYTHVTEVVSRIGSILAQAREPVFIWAHLSDVHFPFVMRKIAGCPCRDFPGTYRGQLAYVDSVLPRFIEEQISARTDLVWALSADHGESLGERGRSFHGYNLHDEQVRVPLIVGGPGLRPAAIGPPVSTAHLGATLLELAGAQLPPELQRLPLRQDLPRERVQPVLVVGDGQCALVSGLQKLIVDCNNGALGLYDLKQDPGEQHNAVDTQRSLAQEMVQQIGRAGCPHDLSWIAF